MKFKQYENGSCDIEFSVKERWLILKKGKIHLSDEALRHFGNKLVQMVSEWNLKFKKDNDYSLNNTNSSNNIENSFINNNNSSSKNIPNFKEINNNTIYLNNQKSLELDRLRILRARRRNL